MPAAPPRKFSLLDAMILVAATALGFFLIRLTFPQWSEIRAVLKRSNGNYGTFLIVQNSCQAIVPILTTWTVALLLLRLRQPRPRLRRALHEPGAVACAAATVAIVLEALWIGGFLAVGSGFIHLSTVFVGYAQEVSFAVLGGWTGLVASGRWRSEPSWVDRLGRMLGAAWIAVTAIHFGSYYLTG